MIFATGYTDFFGACLVLDWFALHGGSVNNLVKITYVYNLEPLTSEQGCVGHLFVQGVIIDVALESNLQAVHPPCAVISLVTKSHVGSSIHDPEDINQTNMFGTLYLIQHVPAYYGGL